MVCGDETQQRARLLSPLFIIVLSILINTKFINCINAISTLQQYKTQEDTKMQEQYSLMDAMGLKWNVRKIY